MTPFTNPETGFSKRAQEVLTRNIAPPNMAEFILNNLRKTGELTSKDEKATKDRLNTDGLANLEPDMRERIEKDHSNFTKLFKRIGIDVPALSEYAVINPAVYTKIESIGKQMELEGNTEYTTTFFPLNLPLDQYRYLAKDITADTTIPNNPLKPQDDGDGLWINDWQKQNYDELQKQDEQYLQSLGATIVEKDSNLRNTNRNYMHTTDTLRWGVAVLPAADTPQDLGKSYNDINGETCTTSQYLTLQFSRIQAGLPPIDKDTRTWLYGKVGDDSPYGSFYRGYGQISAAYGNSAARDPRIGCRPPGVG